MRAAMNKSLTRSLNIGFRLELHGRKDWVMSVETLLVRARLRLYVALGARDAPWSLQGPVHGVPRRPVPEPSPAAEL